MTIYVDKDSSMKLKQPFSALLLLAMPQPC